MKNHYGALLVFLLAPLMLLVPTAHAESDGEGYSIPVEEVPSLLHDFSRVKAHNRISGDTYAVYGKVIHKHEACPTEKVAVEMTVLDPGGNVVASATVSVDPRVKKIRRPAWRAAAFRKSFPGTLAAGSRIRLELKDLEVCPASD